MNYEEDNDKLLSKSIRTLRREVNKGLIRPRWRIPIKSTDFADCDTFWETYKRRINGYESSGYFHSYYTWNEGKCEIIIEPDYYKFNLNNNRIKDINSRLISESIHNELHD